MIDELKRQLAELDKDLAPVLVHVKAVQARRAAIVKAIEAGTTIEKHTPPPKPEKKEYTKDTKDTPTAKKG